MNRNIKNKEKGQALVEAAIVLSFVLIPVLFGIMTIANREESVFNALITARNACFAGVPAGHAVLQPQKLQDASSEEDAARNGFAKDVLNNPMSAGITCGSATPAAADEFIPLPAPGAQQVFAVTGEWNTNQSVSDVHKKAREWIKQSLFGSWFNAAVGGQP